MRKGTCVHFRGIQHDTCLVGVNWREITGGPALGIAKRIPCIKQDCEQAPCPERKEPTDEQIKMHKEEWNKAWSDMRKAMEVASEWRINPKPKEDRTGIVECPVCNGKLHLSQSAYNGHVWAKCETDGCVSWIE